MSDRGQTFTLEAFVAAILLVATVAFVLQAVTITSNTASAGEMEIRGQHAGLAEGVLDEALESGSLRTTLLYWNESSERFYNAGEDGHYVSRMPPTPEGTAFGNSLHRTFGDRQVRYNVDLSYRNATGERQTQRLIESGTPSDDAVRIVETVTLYDDTTLVDKNGDPRVTSLADVEADGEDNFYAPNVDGDSPVYNVIRVEVVLWRT